MSTSTIKEKIKVGAVFDGDRIKPKWFIRNNKKHAVERVTYSWHEKQGEAQVMHFSVTDGATLFEICLNQKTLAWTLEKVNTDD